MKDQRGNSPWQESSKKLRVKRMERKKERKKVVKRIEKT